MMYNSVRIEEHVVKVNTWHPAKEMPEGVFSYIDLSSIDKDRKSLLPEQVQLIPTKEAPSRARQLVEINDVLISTVRPNLNGVAYINQQFENMTASTGYCVLRAKETLDYKYLFYWVRTKTFINDMIRKATGASYPAVSDKIIKSSKIPLPPLPQQKKIAAILDAADAYRQKTKALIAKYEELTQSLFLDMFGDPFNGETKPLKDNINIIGGYAFKSKDFVEVGIPLIKIGTVNKGYFELDNFSFLPKSYLNEYKKWIIEPGDILMSLTGTVGKDDYGNVEIATKGHPKYFLNQRVAKLAPSNRTYLQGFLFGLFNNSKTKKQLTKISRGVRQANISNKDIERLEMIVPSINEQQKYIDAVVNIETQKAKAQTSLAKAENLFNSLLQKAFKGELS